MSERDTHLRPDRILLSRPQAIIDAQQKRHDQARLRALTAFFAAAIIGGGLALLGSKLFAGQYAVQFVLDCLVFLAPLLASLVLLARVPPPPFEAASNMHRDRERKEREWRIALLSNLFMFAMMALQSFWLWPRLGRLPHWIFAGVALFPMFFLLFIAIGALYLRPGWLGGDRQTLFDDEATASFRARAHRLGYLLLLFILMGFCVFAWIDAPAAAHYMPLGLGAGVALPVLYFVYLDWQASRGG